MWIELSKTPTTRRTVKMEQVIVEALENIDRIDDSLSNEEKARLIAEELKRAIAKQLTSQLDYL